LLDNDDGSAFCEDHSAPETIKRAACSCRIVGPLGKHSDRVKSGDHLAR
jgi:hypothetical protein